MKKLVKLFTLSAFLFATMAASAQDAAQPSVDELLTQYYDVIGGEDAWKAKLSMKITGQAEQGGMTFPVTVLSMRPNMQKVEVDIQGQQLVEAFDGEVAWTINPFMGSNEPTKKTEEETSEAAKQMFEDELIDWQAKGHSLSIEGTEEVDGVAAIKLKMAKANGDETIYFFDPENYVPIMMRSFMSFGPMKGKAMDSYVSDYDEVDGVLVPFSMEQKLDGQTIMKMKMEKVEFNVPMEKETFAIPAK